MPLEPTTIVAAVAAIAALVSAYVAKKRTPADISQTITNAAGTLLEQYREDNKLLREEIVRCRKDLEATRRTLEATQTRLDRILEIVQRAGIEIPYEIRRQQGGL